LGPDADWFGHATTEEKKKLLARASALVFPIQWDEPFGIVMVEAMACGTPVVALRAGSVPGGVVGGLTGYICDWPAEAAAAARRGDSRAPRQGRGLRARVPRGHRPGAPSRGRRRLRPLSGGRRRAGSPCPGGRS